MAPGPDPSRSTPTDAPSAPAPQPGSPPDLHAALAALPGVELEMGLGVVAGVLPAYVRLLKKYLEIHEGAMDRFSTHLGVGEVHEARRAAHSLIGASGFIGAPRISRLAQDLERAMEEGDRPDLVRLRADALSREQSDLCGAIRTALRPFEAVPLS